MSTKSCGDTSAGYACMDRATHTLILRPMTYAGEGRIEYRRCRRHAYRYASSDTGRLLAAFVR
jgi:hypothetical protein